MSLKCTLHATWAINVKARQVEDARAEAGAQNWRLGDADNPALIEAARGAPDAEVIDGGKALCLKCFVEGRT